MSAIFLKQFSVHQNGESIYNNSYAEIDLVLPVSAYGLSKGTFVLKVHYSSKILPGILSETLSTNLWRDSSSLSSRVSRLLFMIAALYVNNFHHYYSLIILLHTPPWECPLANFLLREISGQCTMVLHCGHTFLNLS